MSKEEKIQDYPFLHFPLCEPKGPRRREPEQQYTKLGKGGNRPYSPVAAHLSRDKKMQSITEKLRSARKTSGRHYSLYAQRPYPRRLYFAVVDFPFWSVDSRFVPPVLEDISISLCSFSFSGLDSAFLFSPSSLFSVAAIRSNASSSFSSSLPGSSSSDSSSSDSSPSSESVETSDPSLGVMVWPAPPVERTELLVTLISNSSGLSSNQVG